jgi:hypothetical protein
VGNPNGNIPVSVGRRALTPKTSVEWAFVKVVKAAGEGWRHPQDIWRGVPGKIVLNL